MCGVTLIFLHSHKHDLWDGTILEKAPCAAEKNVHSIYWMEFSVDINLVHLLDGVVQVCYFLLTFKNRALSIYEVLPFNFAFSLLSSSVYFMTLVSSGFNAVIVLFLLSCPLNQ